MGDEKNKNSESYVGGRLKMVADLVKKLLIAGSIAASGIGGYVIGNNNTEDNEYQIKRTDSTVVLYNKNIDKEHQIFKINDDFYVGNSEHQLKGLKNVAMYEVMKEMNIDPKTYTPVNK